MMSGQTGFSAFFGFAAFCFVGIVVSLARGKVRSNAWALQIEI